MSLKPVATKAPTAAMIVSQERLRIMNILESPEGKKRPESARKLALNSNMSFEMAVDMLRSLPSESPFLDAMSNEAIGISSATAGAIAASPKEARLAELQQVGKVFGAARGYNVNMKA